MDRTHTTYDVPVLPRSYWRIWSASTISNIGDGMLVVAIPLLAADLTRSPLAIALATVAVRLPWLLFGLAAGAIVDRADRRVTMVAVDIARAACFFLLVVPIATSRMNLGFLYVALFAAGLLETLFDTAAMSILPALVPWEDLERANGRLFASEIAANAFLGPAVGGVLYAAAPWLPIGVDAATFLAASVLVASVAGSFRPGRSSGGSLVRDIAAGMRFVFRDPVIRTFAIGAAMLNLGFTAAMAVLVLHAEANLALGDAGFGLLLAGAAVGGVTGAQTAVSIVGRIGRYRIIVLSVVCMAGGIVAVGWTSRAWVAGVALALVGFSEQIWNVVSVSYRQSRTPEELRGRVMSGFRVIAYGSYPLGALIGGAAATAAGLRAAFLVGAGVVGAVLPLVVRSMSEGRLSDRANPRGL